jgi:hypothetical protein
MLRGTLSHVLLTCLAAAAVSGCAALPTDDDADLDDLEDQESPISAQGSYPIYGIHFYGSGAENTIKNGRGMWSVELIYTKHYTNPSAERSKLQNIKNKGFKIILRLDYDYANTVPNNGDWNGRWEFADTAGKIATDLGDLVDVFVIGNEINPAAGNPTQDWYTVVFNGQDSNCVYDRIKAARPGTKVSIFAPGGWAGDNNLAYWQYVVDHVDKGPDGLPAIDAFAFHSYSGASTDSNKTVEDPRYADKNNFHSFTKYARRVYQTFGASRPIYITETNNQWFYGAWATDQQYSQDVYRNDWVKEAFQAVDEWNQGNDLKVYALSWFVYQHQCTVGCDQYENSLARTDNARLNRARQDYAWVTANANLIPGDPGSTLRFQAESYTNSDERNGMGFTNGLEETDYHDTTAGNTGGAIRAEDVDIGVTPDYSTVFVGWTDPGEWLRYESLSGGNNYRLRVRFSRGAAGTGHVHVTVDGANVSGDVPLASTGNWDAYSVWTSGSTFYLPAGAHDVKLYFDSGAVNIDWFELVRI